jgi:hypothetical protein
MILVLVVLFSKLRSQLFFIDGQAVDGNGCADYQRRKYNNEHATMFLPMVQQQKHKSIEN